MSNKGKLIRGFLWSTVVIGGIALGFIFLLRSCLSQWDSQGIIGWPGISDDHTTLVVVKAYNKTTSYSTGGGITHTSYSTTYYLEKIEMATGKVMDKNKLISHRKLKVYPLQSYGSYKNTLWIFMNELKGYDMTTLKTSITLKDIENKNPSLAGKLPKESQYIDAHVHLGYIYITALDGGKYKLDLNTLIAEEIDEDLLTFEHFDKTFKEQQKKVDLSIDSINTVYTKMYQDYRDKKMTEKVLSKEADRLNNDRSSFYKMRDSLRDMENSARDIFTAEQNITRMMEDFDGFFSNNMQSWAFRNDTLGGKAYILEDMEPNSDSYTLNYYQSPGNETDKMKLYRLQLEKEQYGTFNYKVTGTEKITNDTYLQGGFFRDMFTGLVYQCKQPSGFLIFSRDIIGKKGKLVISRINADGKRLWQTPMEVSTEISFAKVAGNYLVVCSVINTDKKPFQGIDGLRILDTRNGSLVTVKY